MNCSSVRGGGGGGGGELWYFRGLYCRDCVVGCVLRSSVRHAAAAITRCAQLCVQVRGLHLLDGTERGGGRERGGWREGEREGGREGGRRRSKAAAFDCAVKWEIISDLASVCASVFEPMRKRTRSILTLKSNTV